MEERLLPYNIEAERGTLGSILIDSEAIPVVIGCLCPGDFFHAAHQRIYESILFLFNRQIPADLITLSDHLEQRGKLDLIGGVTYLDLLFTYVSTSCNAEYHARIVAQKAGFRRLIHASAQIATLGYEECEDAQEQAEQVLFALQRHITSDFLSLEDVLQSCLVDLDALKRGEQRLLGIPTGLRHLDVVLGGGLQRSDLVILAARPGNGKTSLALTVAVHVALVEKKRVAFFSLEMSAKQLGLRLLAMQADQDQRRLRLGRIDNWDSMVRASDTLAEGAIWIDETASLSHTTLRGKARRLQAIRGVDLVIVDYLQLMHAFQGDNKRFMVREQEIAEISRSLKALAKELNVPVLALAQLSRAVEARQSKRPQLSDLRESGALENDADVVVFIYPEDPSQGKEEPGAKKAVDLIVAKHRNGPTGEVGLCFDPGRTSFYDDFSQE